MAIDVNSTAQLLGAFGVIDRTKPFLLDTFFPQEQVFDTEEIYFDRVARARRIAQLVNPRVEGKAQPSRSHKTGSFKPAYLKPKHAIDPTIQIKRRAGERLLGSLTPEERFELALYDNLRIEDDEITRFEEWLASQLLINGSVTLSSPDFQAVTIDLQRNTAHTVVLTGGSRWGQSGVDALANLRSWAQTVHQNASYHPGLVVMDPGAMNLFLQSPGVTRVMNTFRQTSGNIDLGGATTGALGREARYMGSLAEFDFVQYSQYYTDPAGNIVNIMPANTVIMGDPVGCQGVRTYGAILDFGVLRPEPRFPKVWKEEDPSVWYSMTQSSPLPLLGWADATFCATVA